MVAFDENAVVSPLNHFEDGPFSSRPIRRQAKTRGDGVKETRVAPPDAGVSSLAKDRGRGFRGARFTSALAEHFLPADASEFPAALATEFCQLRAAGLRDLSAISTRKTFDFVRHVRPLKLLDRTGAATLR